jgi:hypothetical protein
MDDGPEMVELQYCTVGWNRKRGDCMKEEQERLKGERYFG